jgi:PAS domain S-box-containing protein
MDKKETSPPAPAAAHPDRTQGHAMDDPIDHPIDAPINYRLAFDYAPVGMVLSRQRIILDCNQRVCEIFGTERETLIGQSFALLYPSTDEFERIGARISSLMGTHSTYADDRIMRRVGGHHQGELFWCHVTGRALDPTQPLGPGIWTFEDLSAHRPVRTGLTAREREVAARLLEGLTSKEIGKALSISHRTVEIYRARLMRKYQAATTAELVHKLTLG